MAQKVSVTVTSDLSGAENAETVTFGLDGTTYEIDLTEDETSTLREILAPYVGAARKAAGGRGPRKATAVHVGPDPKAVRAWAASKGISVPERGRLPKDVTEQFLSDHGDGAKPASEAAKPAKKTTAEKPADKATEKAAS